MVDLADDALAGAVPLLHEIFGAGTEARHHHHRLAAAVVAAIQGVVEIDGACLRRQELVGLVEEPAEDRAEVEIVDD